MIYCNWIVTPRMGKEQLFGQLFDPRLQFVSLGEIFVMGILPTSRHDGRVLCIHLGHYFHRRAVIAQKTMYV